MEKFEWCDNLLEPGKFSASISKRVLYFFRATCFSPDLLCAFFMFPTRKWFQRIPSASHRIPTYRTSLKKRIPYLPHSGKKLNLKTDTFPTFCILFFPLINRKTEGNRRMETSPRQKIISAGKFARNFAGKVSRLFSATKFADQIISPESWKSGPNPVAYRVFPRWIRLIFFSGDEDLFFARIRIGMGNTCFFSARTKAASGNFGKTVVRNFPQLRRCVLLLIEKIVAKLILAGLRCLWRTYVEKFVYVA